MCKYGICENREIGGVISLRIFNMGALAFLPFAVFCVSMHGYYEFRIGIGTE